MLQLSRFPAFGRVMAKKDVRSRSNEVLDDLYYSITSSRTISFEPNETYYGCMRRYIVLTDEVVESEKSACELIWALHDDPYPRPNACIDEF